MRRGLLSRKQSGVGVDVACRGGGVVEGEELDPNPMSFSFFFSFFYIIHSLFLGTRGFVQC